MKRFALYFGLAAALVASCSTKEIDIQTPQQGDVEFYASFEQPTEDGTRVYANEDLLLRWTADDRVSIFNKLTYNQEYKFTGETGDNAGGFKKVDTDEFVTGNAISHVVSVYPYQETTKITESEALTLTLPAEQHYAENTFGLGANTMVSVTADNVLQYKTVGGYLRLSLYGKDVNVSSIILKGNNGERLAGSAYVAMPLDGTPSVSMADDATDAITLDCDSPVALGATAEESTHFWFAIPPVTFSKGFTIMVSGSEGVFEKSTEKTVTIERNKLLKMSPIEVESSIQVPEAVDLGLPSGIKWASFNIGATQPEEYGDYYAWGEVEPKSEYSWETYKWYSGDVNSMTKYNTTDNRTTLEPEDDAATSIYGGEWRMPGYDEFQELMNQCVWQYTTLNGHNGYRVTGPNGNSVFFPAAGNSFSSSYAETWGCYWGADLGRTSLSSACNFDFVSSFTDLDDDFRYYGRSIRAVCGPRKDTSITVPEAVDLGLSVKWASFNVGASKPEEYGDYYAWGEIDTKDDYSWQTYKWCLGISNTPDADNLTKYNTKAEYGIIDNLTVLEAEDDVASVKLGGSWRIPTYAEWQELVSNCQWEYTSYHGVTGFIVTSKKSGYTDKFIFLPAAGTRLNKELESLGVDGNYSSSTLYTEDPDNGLGLAFWSSTILSRSSYDGRRYGRSIRPVCAE